MASGQRTWAVVTAGLLLLGAAPPAPLNDADRRAWMSDFRALLAEMSAHYANLEWAAARRHVDLRAVRTRTEERIADAGTVEEAQQVFKAFTGAFGDGHLSVSWAKPHPAEASDGGSPCAAYTEQNKPGIDFSLLPAFTVVQGGGNEFPGGILKLRDGTTIGTLRIGIFSERAFPDACREALPSLSLPEGAPCDEACDDRLEQATGSVLVRRLERRVEALKSAGAKAILVDATANGGGSNWVDPVARTLSSVRLREEKMGFVRHPHWTSQFEAALKDVEEDLRGGRGRADLLRPAEETLRHAIALSKQACDRMPLWNGEELDCSLVEASIWHPSGVLAYARPGAFAQLHSRGALFSPGAYDYVERQDRLPLFVAVDANTWSAAEFFASLLQDNKAARIVGELTGGAGCGYTNGGIPFTLPHSGGRVRMPDCVRLRADGSNEVEGVTPDIPVPWAPRDTRYQQAAKLARALEHR
jgi:hypothetical protein